MYSMPNPLNIMFPGAAGNMQSFFSPTYTFNYAGNPAIEREISEDVASFGKQIGWLNDIVVALAGKQDDPQAQKRSDDALIKLTSAMADIDKIKKRRKDDAYHEAKRALDALAEADDVKLRMLLSSFTATAKDDQ